MTVAELLARISSEELAEWRLYAAMRGGFSAERTERAIALLCTITANVNRKRGSPAFRVEQFLPRFAGEDADKGKGQPLDSLRDYLLRRPAPSR
jgi:hypothetical protein